MVFRFLLMPFAKWYVKKVEHHLNKYGLRYEDLILETPDVQEALRLLPKEEKILRHRRILRASDLQSKHEELPKHIQEIQNPFNNYLSPYIAKVQKKRLERVYYK